MREEPLRARAPALVAVRAAAAVGGLRSGATEWHSAAVGHLVGVDWAPVVFPRLAAPPATVAAAARSIEWYLA